MERNDLRTGVLIPVLQAAITGIVSAAVVVSIYKLADKVTTFRLFCVVAFLVMAIAWMVMMQQWRGYTFSMRQIDTPVLYNMDTPDVTRIAVPRETGEDWIDLPIDKSRLMIISRKIQKDMRLSHALVADRTLTRAEYEALRDEMVRRGLAQWVNPRARNQGVVLTGAGRAMVRHYATTALPKSIPIGELN